MTRLELKECAAILRRTLANLLGTVPVSVGRGGADLRRAAGDLAADAETLISTNTVGVPLQNCFALASAAGADLPRMGRVRTLLLEETPASPPATALVQGAVVFALSQEARIIAAMTFTSRNDVDALILRMNAEFADAEEAAADALDLSYRAVVALHAAVTRHLVTTERPLPRMVSYAFPRGLPTLVIAQRLYYDAGRADELRNENKVVHPLFAPRSGRALSA